LHCAHDCGGFRAACRSSSHWRKAKSSCSSTRAAGRHIKRLRAGHRITIRSVIIQSSALIGAPEGMLVGRGPNDSFRVFRPLYADLASVIDAPRTDLRERRRAHPDARGECARALVSSKRGVGGVTLTNALLAAVGPHGSLAELRDTCRPRRSGAAQRRDVRTGMRRSGNSSCATPVSGSTSATSMP
jgi:hypothetical protein